MPVDLCCGQRTPIFCKQSEIEGPLRESASSKDCAASRVIFLSRNSPRPSRALEQPKRAIAESKVGGVFLKIVVLCSASAALEGERE